MTFSAAEICPNVYQLCHVLRKSLRGGRFQAVGDEDPKVKGTRKVGGAGKMKS